MDKKKKILIILIIFVAIAVSITIYFIIKNQNKNAVDNLVQQDSLSTSSQKIELGKTTLENTGASVYSISTNTSLTKVQDFVQRVDPKMKAVTQEEGDYYRWENGDDYVIYELDQNYLLFNIESGLEWNEVSLNNYSFSQFTNQYFDKSWSYTFVDSKKMSTGETIYYAKRSVDGIDIETTLDKQETDYIAMKNGKIVYGKILLMEMGSSRKNIPLISEEDLKNNINSSLYPKEIYPQFGAMQSSVLSGVDYKSDEFATIANTLSNCESGSAQVVYLYKNMAQKTMTPVYKLDLSCTVEYNDTSYDIPAIGYVNAIDPQYVSSE